MHPAATIRPSPEDARPTLPRRLWRPPLWAHAAVLALALMALLPLMTPRGSFTSDEGAYALQERALASGDWAFEYPAAALDPEGRYFPLNNSDRGQTAFFPYIKHPVYPLLLRGATTVLGQTAGLHVLALLGVLGTAVAAWLLAGELNPRLSRPAFWVAVSGPVLVNGYLLWAHALSAAVAGFAVLGAVRLVRVNSAGRPAGLLLPTAAVATCLVAGVLLRAEGLLFAGALAVAVGAVLVRPAGLGRAAVTLGALAGPALLASLAEARWVQAIVGGPHQSLAVRGETESFVTGRFRGAWHELFQAHISTSVADVALFVALGLVVGVGYVALRRWGPTSRRDVTLAASAGAVLYLLRLRWEPIDLITGLFTAWPIVLLGLLLFAWRRPGPVGAVLGITSALFAAAVFATQYSNGGGAEWGGRFLSPIVVALAVLATAGIGRALAAAPRPDRGWVAGALTVLAVSTAVVGLVSVGNRRHDQDRMVRAVARHRMPVTVTTLAGLPRMAWATHDEVTWMYVEEQDLTRLLADLRRQGLDEVGVVTAKDDSQLRAGPYGALEELDEPDLRRFGIGLYRLRS